MPDDKQDSTRAYDWRTYDTVAAGYERLAARYYTQAPARDAVSALALPEDARVLDVGTGTGAALHELCRIYSGGAVGVDPSVAMLERARGSAATLIAAALPDLPFVDGAFDGAVSAFVITHVTDPAAAVAEVTRVLTPGGRVALATWADFEKTYDRVWSDVVEEQVGADALKETSQLRPHEEYLAQRDNLEELARDAGLANVEIDTKTYSVCMAVPEYLSLKSLLLSGRYLKWALTATQKRALDERLADAFHERYGGSLAFENQVNLLTASRPLL